MAQTAECGRVQRDLVGAPMEIDLRNGAKFDDIAPNLEHQLPEVRYTGLF